MRKLTINDREISLDSGAYIVAEIAGNFSSIDEAMKLIDSAVYAGADAIKLQTYTADRLTSKQAVYEMENTGNVNQHALFKEGELTRDKHELIYQYARKIGIDVFSTPSHIADVELLESIGTSVYKIGSDDSNNLPFIEEVARMQKPLIVATGMRTIHEVDEIVNSILKHGNSNFALLHTVTAYPTDYEIANLKVIHTYLQRYPGILIGYSDHTIGWQCAYAARVLGAMIIERHFTLNRGSPGPDHMLSSEPEELKLLVDAIRIFESALGNGVKMPISKELTNRTNNSKSIVLEKSVKKGERLSNTHLAIKRPGTGIEPKYLEQIFGRTVSQDLSKDDVLTWDDLSG